MSEAPPGNLLVVQAAAEFGSHVRHGGWRLGYLVACCVEPGEGQTSGLLNVGTTVPTNEKVSAREFAERAGTSHPRVLRYLAAWERAAADDGLVPHAAELEPADKDDEARIPNDEDVPWSRYYRDEKDGRPLDVHFSSDTDEWATPDDLFAQLDDEFGFTLDVCANSENAKCDAYFDRATDGLAQEWSGICWMNPPYGDVISRWVEKAHASAVDGTTVVCLVPARTDTGWWWDHARHGEVRFLRGRLRFGGGETGAPFPSAVVVFGAPPCVIWWER